MHPILSFSLAVFLSATICSCGTTGTNNAALTQQNKQVQAPQGIKIRMNGYDGNIAVDGVQLFYVKGQDTTIAFTDGTHYLNLGATVGDRTPPTSYIYFVVKNGVVDSVETNDAVTISADKKIMTFNVARVSVLVHDYKLAYYPSIYHVQGKYKFFSGDHTYPFVKGLVYNINNEGYTGTSYFYFNVNANGSLTTYNCNLFTSDTSVSTQGYTLSLKTVEKKIIPQQIAGASTLILPNAIYTTNILHDTCITFIRGLNAELWIGDKDHHYDFTPFMSDCRPSKMK